MSNFSGQVHALVTSVVATSSYQGRGAGFKVGVGGGGGGGEMERALLFKNNLSKFLFDKHFKLYSTS